MITAGNIPYESAERVHGLAAGGIGALILLARHTGRIAVIDTALPLLKRHLPAHESDHVLKIALAVVAGGDGLEHIELRRHDAVFLDALGADRIPDPTTEGDFCRRSRPSDVLTGMAAIPPARLRVGSPPPADVIGEAIGDGDGTLVGTAAACQADVDRAADGPWGSHPLRVALANTGEPRALVPRRGHRPAHAQAHIALDQTIALGRRGGLLRIDRRGDTDFSRTEDLDGWADADDVRFRFGIDAHPTLQAPAAAVAAGADRFLERPPA
jgi:hypothetical protein